ncbi:ATP-binding cassette domain-containing protein [Saccharicrinis fermentans]|uniref:Lipoprotein-releasing system ATP-binding protein LolD n=1 Tax=Saccharicrinis fermentans DSM 9555 = JCM 21142 TaxID=869213 RepID=W7Y6X7_9BACT|nr:ATP-binding cassette domain-containing protein [Saccharicrinis fermentans]GAF04012.1 lipoprotein-releasing system ATP-binding protein LolD [Saccharicrinis fermentans DSM 9555 = JCM 21142]
MDPEIILHKPLKEIVIDNPIFTDFFHSFHIDAQEESKSFIELMDQMNEAFWEERACSRQELTTLFIEFINGICAADSQTKIENLDVLAGVNKLKEPEKCSLHLQTGEITCIVGPTGSGKSRLLADIEWLAQMDTPTQRKVLINGREANDDTAALFGGKLIAQITQNMNFVLDMDVENFLMLHAQSRFLPNAEQMVKEVISLANELSGEPFEKNTAVTFLSGGQSRALMIADVACIGQAPIVLIDEIENAGVNKKKALNLLVNKDKIVLMATHDPLLILLADKRVVIKNGGMEKVIKTNSLEKAYYKELEALDSTLQKTKDFFRVGNELQSGKEL